MTKRTPQEGGIMNGGPFCGRIMAYGGPAMPAIDETGKQVGTYFWDEDHWEYDKDDSKVVNLFPGGWDD